MKSSASMIDPHQTGFVGKGSDHLQLIKFWPSCTPGKVCGGAKIFGSALLQPVCSVCISCERFLPARRSKHGICYGNVAGWVVVTAGIVSKRLNLS